MLLLLTWLCSGVLAVKLRLSQIHFKPGKRVLAETFTSAHPDPFQDCETSTQDKGCDVGTRPQVLLADGTPQHTS